LARDSDMNEKLNNLQALRAFAAINVAAYHAIGDAAKYRIDTGVLEILNGWGRNGVDIFFVLSGFIMILITSGRDEGPWRFLMRRFVRIVPLYWIVSAVLLFIAMVIPAIYPSQDENVIRHFLASIMFVSRVALGRDPIIYDGWTLEYEMLFYTILAICMIWARSASLVISASLAIFALSLYSSANLILVEFIFGMVTGYVCVNLEKSRKIYVSLLITSVTIFIITIFFRPDQSYPNLGRVLGYGVPTIFIVYGLSCLKQMRSGVLSFIGDASYSIYLIQVLTIPACYKAISFFGMQSHLRNEIFITSTIFITICFGAIFHVYIERPAGLFVKNIMSVPKKTK
jgi:exopolysaccharide production protein ExoZ